MGLDSFDNRLKRTTLFTATTQHLCRIETSPINAPENIMKNTETFANRDICKMGAVEESRPFTRGIILRIYRVPRPDCRQGMGQDQVASWRCILL